MVKITKEAALLYHSQGKPGKIEVIPTKPYQTQTDLSLAYSPGVAEPCLEIQKAPSTVYDYTAKGNLVAVISNGTAVLGLGAKTFSATELLARIRVEIRHLHKFADVTPKPVLFVGDLSINLEKRVVKLKGEEIHVTPLEYDLL